MPPSENTFGKPYNPYAMTFWLSPLFGQTFCTLSPKMAKSGNLCRKMIRKRGMVQRRDDQPAKNIMAGRGTRPFGERRNWFRVFSGVTWYIAMH